MDEDSNLPADVLEAVHANRKIDAIKRLRNQRGIDLKEAKGIIDADIAEYSQLFKRRQPREESAIGGIVVVGIIVAVIYIANRYLL